MPAIIEDFWPNSIDVRILTPLTILRSQAAFLGKRTGGLLTGHIATDRAPDKMSHRFYAVASAPNRILVPILEASHSVSQVYPVEVVSRAFDPKPSDSPFVPMHDLSAKLDKLLNRHTAVTQDAFIALVKEVLNSEAIVASINSIIAMSNEADEPPAEGGTEPRGEEELANRSDPIESETPSP